jgi:nitronate monooxygenase
VFVHGHEFRAGLRLVRSLTPNPVGVNALIEKSSRTYRERMERWVDVALEEGVRFFVSSLGNPAWLVQRLHPVGAVLYHDVTEAKWGRKALDAGVDGLIAVNNRAGGHAGGRSAEELVEELSGFGLPLICAGGVGEPEDFVRALRLGYAGVQMGTRFIATTECRAHPAYKQALVDATEDDVVLTERITGVPVSVLRTPQVERVGTRAGPLARRLLRGRRTKHLMRTLYALRSLWQLKRSLLRAGSPSDYWQAGKSVRGIHAIEPTAEIIRRFARAAQVALAADRRRQANGAARPTARPA